MKFINYLTKTENIEWLGLTSFIIFFLLFLYILYRVFFTSKEEIEHIEKLPLEDK